MAARHLLLCLMLYVATNIVDPNSVVRSHVSEVGRTVTAFCPHNKLYTSRKWTWASTILRPYSVIYQQDSGGAVEAGTGARADISINLTDWSLTIGSLQVTDTEGLRCVVFTGGKGLYVTTWPIVYNSVIEVRLGTSVTLQCPVDAAGFKSRLWYTRPVSVLLLYNQTTAGVTEGRSVRDDISLDTVEFDLTIGNVSQGDKIFTCIATSQHTTNAVGIIFLAIYSVVLEVEEGTSVTLPCDGVKRYASRNPHWYTRTWQRVNGDVLYLQYRINGVFYERPAAARADMSLNNDTFELTIGTVQLADDGMFIWTFESSVESVKLVTYINPKIILSGLDDTPVSVGSTVTVTCTIGRVYPELEPDAFIMRWGTQTIMSTGSQNNDKSYRYSIQTTHAVTTMTNVVECLVNPTRGQSDSISKTIYLNGQKQNPSTSPTDAVSPSGTSEGSTPVSSGLSLPVIGGAAAAAAAVLIIIVIVLSVCLCVRRMNRINKVSNQARRTGESHRHELDVPDVTIRNKTYLPAADYNEYEEIGAQGGVVMPTGVVPVHTIHKVDTGIYLPQDDTYLDLIDAGSYVHAPRAEEPIQGAPAVPSYDRQYEKLRASFKLDSPIETWLKARGIPKVMAKKLKCHGIVTVQDLQDMSRADMMEAGLNVGDRNRIKRALKDTTTSQSN